MGDFALPTRRPTGLGPAERLSSDEWLARRVSMGSTRAFAVLYGRHHQALYRYCRSIVRNEDDAQDALQSAMMRALASLQARQRDVAVRPWLFRIVHNEAVSLLRSRRPNSSLGEGPEPLDGGLESTLLQRERFAGLLADLQCLAERQRAALVMRELSGLSIAEIAAALSTSPGAAKQAIFEARCALQEFEEGRAMECEAVRQAISDGDGRALRARKIRAHVRACAGCRDFEDMITARTAELHALAPPLPAVAATAMLARLLAHGAGGGRSAVAAAASGAAIGNHVAMSVTVKALAAVAIVSAATAGAVHVTAGTDRHPTTRSPTQRTPLSSGAAGAGEGAQAGPAASATLRPGAAAKLHRAPRAKNGRAPLEAGAGLGAAATTIRGQHGRLASEIAGGHGRSAGGSGTGVRRGSSSPRARTGHGRRSPGRGKSVPTHGTGKEGSAAPSAPLAERAPTRGGLNHPLPNGEPEAPLAPTTPSG
jgi:RNA polymerase sigma factor (sigma-70 family)